MTISDVITLLGGIALFLYGMSVMGDNLKKVAGSKLEVFLYRLSSTPIRGILLGTGVTAVIQSSSATSIMVVGFVNSGMMKVRQAIGVIMGSILGTSITGWILALGSISGGRSGWLDLLSTATLTGIIAVVGILLRMISHKAATRHVGAILMGFAVLMYGMSMMSGAVEPLRESQVFVNVLTTFSNPLLGILAGMLFTAVVQSASAAVGIVQALAVTGAITFDVALPIIMGIAIGAAVPVLISALGASTNGVRTALVYLLTDILGVAMGSALFYGANAIFHFGFMQMVMTAFTIAALNTAFRLFSVVLLTPFIPLMERLVCVLVPDKPGSANAQDMDLLEERFLQHPALSIEQSRLVTNSMAQKARRNLMDAIALRTNYSDKGYQAVVDMEDMIDRYEDKLGTYLMKITNKALSVEQSEDVSKYLHTISDFERISDHAVNVADLAQELHEKNVDFSPTARKELGVMESAVSEILTLAIDAFVNSDEELAARVEPLEEIIDGLCDELKLHHVDRLQAGQCTLSQGFVFNDLLTNYERVADHCSNIAVALIELDRDTFDTHEYLNSVRDMKSASFERYYDEYKAKFAV